MIGEPMIRLKQVKKELGEGYVFIQHISPREVRRLMRNYPEHKAYVTVCELIVGCVKIEVSLFEWHGRARLGYDVFVKESPDAAYWICYDSPEDEVVLKENNIFAVLDRIVTEKGLSYTECNFEIIDGKKNLRKKF